MNRYDRDTAVLRHLADGPKFEADFNLSFSAETRANNPKMRRTAVGGMRALWRCEAGGWVEMFRQEPHIWARYWRITDAGRAELERREAEAAAS
jgi:hypothetical protein